MIDYTPLTDAAKLFLTERTEIDFRTTTFDRSWLCITSHEDGTVNGVLVAEFVNPYDAHITIALDNPRLMTRRLLRIVFRTLFIQAVRLTAQCRPENEKSWRLIQKLGFRYEGFCRLGIEGQWDALVFGMLRNECRWLGAPVKLAKAA